jgi:hypothetical protein
MPDEKKESADLQANDTSVMGFLQGLWEAMKMGAQNTGYALRDDWTDIQEHNLPHNIMRDLPGLVTMAGSPEITPSIPALQYKAYAAGPEGPGQFLMQTANKVYPGGNPLEQAMRGGHLGDIPQEWMRWFEKAREWNTPPAPR